MSKHVIKCQQILKMSRGVNKCKKTDILTEPYIWPNHMWSLPTKLNIQTEPDILTKLNIWTLYLNWTKHYNWISNANQAFKLNRTQIKPMWSFQTKLNIRTVYSNRYKHLNRMFNPNQPFDWIKYEYNPCDLKFPPIELIVFVARPGVYCENCLCKTLLVFVWCHNQNTNQVHLSNNQHFPWTNWYK